VLPDRDSRRQDRDSEPGKILLGAFASHGPAVSCVWATRQLRTVTHSYAQLRTVTQRDWSEPVSGLGDMTPSPGACSIQVAQIERPKGTQARQAGTFTLFFTELNQSSIKAPPCCHSIQSSQASLLPASQWCGFDRGRNGRPIYRYLCAAGRVRGRLGHGPNSDRCAGAGDTHRHTDTQTHRHTDTQTHRHTDTQTHRHTDTQTQTHRHTDTQTCKVKVCHKVLQPAES
jgi:hypothetical protein